MTLCDAVNDFRNKIAPNSPDTRYCTFALPEETAGVIDLSPSGDGSRGIAFLADRMVIKLGADARQIYYRSIRVTEILPSYETPFEDELVLASPSGDIRISDCGLNKFFLRQLISTVCRMSNTMSAGDREAFSDRLTSEALSYYSGLLDKGTEQLVPEKAAVTAPQPSPVPEAAAAVPEIAAAKKAALAEARHSAPVIEITEEKIEWLSGKREPVHPAAPTAVIDIQPEETLPEEALEDMSHEQTMSYLLDSIAEINSAPEEPSAPTQTEPEPEQPEVPAERLPEPPVQEPEAPKSTLTIEPDSPDIYIQASRKIRELCDDGRLTMEQVNAAVKEQLVAASEYFSGLDLNNAPLPPAVKKRALLLSSSADKLPEYFALGEDIAARVMFFMLYQMLSYTDRIVQTDETKQRLNYFFVRFGAAGMILSMLDANN